MSDDLKESVRAKINIRIPGLKKGKGAGDVVRSMTDAMDIEPCDECEKRKKWLDRWLRFTGSEDE